MADHTMKAEEVSGWVAGFSNFAGILLVISGVFQFFQGLAALINPNYFVVGEKYLFHINVATWGWVHLLWGLLVALSGFYIFSRSVVARTIGITLAGLSAIANFFYIPYYPIWSLLIIALDITIISALTLYHRED